MRLSVLYAAVRPLHGSFRFSKKWNDLIHKLIRIIKKFIVCVTPVTGRYRQFNGISFG